ncbi:MAG: hypothetical protein FWE74_02850 [Oscillospiraceae bacterium]|nr:hypothetical protein [Oscillospiraceae bacterium]
MYITSANFMTKYADAMTKANKFVKKCKVEERLGVKMQKDVFYYIIESDIRKLEDEKQAR